MKSLPTPLADGQTQSPESNVQVKIVKSTQNFPFCYSGRIPNIFTLFFYIISVSLVTAPLLEAEAEVRGNAKGKGHFSVTEIQEVTLLLLQILGGLHARKAQLEPQEGN